MAPDGGGGALASVKKRGLNEDSMKVPFAFAELVANECSGCEETDNLPSIINERSQFLTDCLLKVCDERNLPLALKIGEVCFFSGVTWVKSTGALFSSFSSIFPPPFT